MTYSTTQVIMPQASGTRIRSEPRHMRRSGCIRTGVATGEITCPMGIPTLRTERLVLREPTPADAPAVLVFRGDPRVQRFNDEPLLDVAAAEAFIEFLRADSASDARRHWAIFRCRPRRAAGVRTDVPHLRGSLRRRYPVRGGELRAKSWGEPRWRLRKAKRRRL